VSSGDAWFIERDRASGFIALRRAAGKSYGTVNHSLRLLIRMFSLAQDNERITLAPKFELPREKSRQGVLPPEQFLKLFNAMPARLQPLLLLLYHTGVRVGEAERIPWSAVDLTGARITLQEGGTKNDDPRVLPKSNALVKPGSRFAAFLAFAT
jgi:integrase